MAARGLSGLRTLAESGDGALMGLLLRAAPDPSDSKAGSQATVVDTSIW
jgi:hypothetical protein